MPGSCEKNGIFIGEGEFFQTNATAIFGLIDMGPIVIRGTSYGFVAQSEGDVHCQHFYVGEHLETTHGRIKAVATVPVPVKPRKWWSRRSR